MDSNLEGLRPLEVIGLSLSDCSDLPIHQELFPHKDSCELKGGG